MSAPAVLSDCFGAGAQSLKGRVRALDHRARHCDKSVLALVMHRA